MRNESKSHGISEIDQAAAVIFADSDLYTRMRDSIYSEYGQPLSHEGQEIEFDNNQMALAALDPQPGDFIVDLCCGSGNFARQVAEACPQATVLGIDTSGSCLQQAQLLTPLSMGNVAYQQADVRDLRQLLQDGSANKVSINNGLHHIDDPQEVMLEMRRIMADGATGVAQTRGVATLSRQWEMIHRVCRAKGVEPKDSPYWNFHSAEAPERLGEFFEVIPFEPFDKLANSETQSVLRLLAMGVGAWPFYSETLVNGVTATARSQNNYPVAPDFDRQVRAYVKRHIYPTFMQEILSDVGYFSDTLEEGLVKFKKPSSSSLAP